MEKLVYFFFLGAICLSVCGLVTMATSNGNVTPVDESIQNVTFQKESVSEDMIVEYEETPTEEVIEEELTPQDEMEIREGEIREEQAAEGELVDEDEIIEEEIPEEEVIEDVPPEEDPIDDGLVPVKEPVYSTPKEEVKPEPNKDVTPNVNSTKPIEPKKEEVKKPVDTEKEDLKKPVEKKGDILLVKKVNSDGSVFVGEENAGRMVEIWIRG